MMMASPSSSSAEEDNTNREAIQKAIMQLLEENKNKTKSQNEHKDEEEETRRLLSRLLSQLHISKAHEEIRKPNSLSDSKDKSYTVEQVERTNENLDKMEVRSHGIDNAEIALELRKVKRQNFITHCLLSAMIVLTIGWQLSEVSLILMLKDGMRHPFRFLGSIVKGMLKGPQIEDSREKESSTTLKIPELSCVEFLTSNSSNDRD